MALTSLTTDFLRRLPAGLRPKPYNIEEFLMNLSAKGWTVEDMITAVMADRPMQPGHVFARLKGMQEEPAPLRSPTSSKVRDMKHAPCNDRNHAKGCEICYCNVCRPSCTIDHVHERWPQHHVSVPMPAWFKEKYGGTLRTFGVFDE